MPPDATTDDGYALYQATVSFGQFRCDRVYRIRPDEFSDAIREEWLVPFADTDVEATPPVDELGNPTDGDPADTAEVITAPPNAAWADGEAGTIDSATESAADTTDI